MEGSKEGHHLREERKATISALQQNIVALRNLRSWVTLHPESFDAGDERLLSDHIDYHESELNALENGKKKEAICYPLPFCIYGVANVHSVPKNTEPDVDEENSIAGKGQIVSRLT